MKNQPTHRVNFARIIGQDDEGKDQLAYGKEIGTIWPCQNGNGSVLKLDIIPIELTRREGVIFINEIKPKS